MRCDDHGAAFAVQSGRKKTREPKEENVTLGPTVREGEYVFGVAHIFASFNDTFIVRSRPPSPPPLSRSIGRLGFFFLLTPVRFWLRCSMSPICPGGRRSSASLVKSSPPKPLPRLSRSLCRCDALGVAYCLKWWRQFVFLSSCRDVFFLAHLLSTALKIASLSSRGSVSSHSCAKVTMRDLGVFLWSFPLPVLF